jgi:hypothetical protein
VIVNLPDYYQGSALTPPHWRFIRLKALARNVATASGKKRASVRDDPWTKEAHAFLKELDNAQTETDHACVFRRNPHFYHAYELYIADTPEAEKQRLILEARLLSGLSMEEIADKNRLSFDAVKAYEALFFDVTEHLDKSDWIHARVLMPAERRSYVPVKYRTAEEVQYDTIAHPLLDASLKYFAYYGGPYVCDFFIRGCRDLPQPTSASKARKTIATLFTDRVMVKSLTAVHKLKATNFNANDFVNTYARFQELTLARAKAHQATLPTSGSNAGATTQALAKEMQKSFECVPFSIRSVDNDAVPTHEQRDDALFGGAEDAFANFPGFGTRAVAKDGP